MPETKNQAIKRQANEQHDQVLTIIQGLNDKLDDVLYFQKRAERFVKKQMRVTQELINASRVVQIYAGKPLSDDKDSSFEWLTCEELRRLSKARDNAIRLVRDYHNGA